VSLIVFGDLQTDVVFIDYVIILTAH
jgi:hypothetical protein